MSRYSGKCDFYDHLWTSANTANEAFSKFNGTKLYLVQPLPDDFDFQKAFDEKINIPETYYKKIEYTSIKDLIPYYPHLISAAACHGTKACNSIICLSAESFVNKEEREIIEYNFKKLMTIYKRCKRKKIEFDIDKVLEEITYGTWSDTGYKILAERVKEKGIKANLNDIHLEISEYYREMLVEEMIKYDLNPADYGYERFV